jgi:hypothetical protein
MEIEENVNPGTEKRQFSKIPFENRQNMRYQLVVCDSRHLPARVGEELADAAASRFRVERLVRCILTELMKNFARTLVLVRHHKPLRGGTSAPQNLQGTVWLLLLAGTT